MDVSQMIKIISYGFIAISIFSFSWVLVTVITQYLIDQKTKKNFKYKK